MTVKKIQYNNWSSYFSYHKMIGYSNLFFFCSSPIWNSILCAWCWVTAAAVADESSAAAVVTLLRVWMGKNIPLGWLSGRHVHRTCFICIDNVLVRAWTCTGVRSQCTSQRKRHKQRGLDRVCVVVVPVLAITRYSKLKIPQRPFILYSRGMHSATLNSLHQWWLQARHWQAAPERDRVGWSLAGL